MHFLFLPYCRGVYLFLTTVPFFVIRCETRMARWWWCRARSVAGSGVKYKCALVAQRSAPYCSGPRSLLLFCYSTPTAATVVRYSTVVLVVHAHSSHSSTVEYRLRTSVAYHFLFFCAREGGVLFCYCVVLCCTCLLLVSPY